MDDVLSRHRPSRRLGSVVATLAVFSLALLSSAVATADDHSGASVPSGQLPQLGSANSVSVHDPTMVYDEGTERYVIAATHNSIRSAPTKNGPWTTHGNVARAPWTQQVPNSSTLWAPHLQRIGDTYYYFYSQSSFGSQNSGIGLKTTQTPTIPSSYVDLGRPIVTSGTWYDPDWDDPIDHNAIDPAVLQDEHGDWWMVWGSHWDGIVIQRLDDTLTNVTGEMTLIASRAAANNPIEGPAIFHRDGYYYLLTGWDSCCAGANSTYKVSVGRSTSIDGPYVDKNGVPLTEGGGTTILDSRVTQPGVTPSGLYRAPGGPDIFVEDGVYYMVYHGYLPQNRLGIRPMDWHDGWPFFQEPGGGPYDLTDGAYHRLVSEAEPFEPPVIDRVPGPDGFGDAVRRTGPSPVGYVEMPTGIVSDLDGDFTISIWVNRATTGQAWSRILDFGTDTSNFMFLTPNAGASPTGMRLDLNPATANAQQIPGTGNGQQLPTGWQHVTVTLSGDTGTIWLNGEPYRTNANFTHRLADLGETTRNWIGRSQYEADAWLNATVDDMNIFSRALSQAEIQALMTEPGGGDAIGGGDVAWYRFDEDGGALAVDSSGQGQDATVVVPSTDEDRLQNPVPGNQCLTAVQGADGVEVIQADCTEEVSLGQVWRLEREFDGFYRFRTSLAGGDHCLEMTDASGTPGTDVVAGPCDGGEDLQEWYLDDTGHGFHRPVVKGANLALEIENEAGVIGTNVIGGLRADPPIANKWPPQQWQLQRVSMSAEQVLAFFDASVADDGLVGAGPGNSAAGRLGAFRNQLVHAVELLEAGDYAAAHDQLSSTLQRLHTDGSRHASHFVTGDDAAELAVTIRTLMSAIG